MIYIEHNEAVRVTRILNDCENIIAVVVKCEGGYRIEISKHEPIDLSHIEDYE